MFLVQSLILALLSKGITRAATKFSSVRPIQKTAIQLSSAIPKSRSAILYHSGGPMNAIKNSAGYVPQSWGSNHLKTSIDRQKSSSDFVDVDDKVNQMFLFSVANNQLNKVISYFNQGAEVNMKYRNGDTALIIAAKSGYTDVVDYLLYKGAEVTSENDDGCSALAFAVISKNNEMVLQLLDGIESNDKYYFSQVVLILSELVFNAELKALISKNGIELDKNSGAGIVAYSYFNKCR